MTKKEIRKKYASLRSELSDYQVNTKSLEILENLKSLPIWHLNSFHIFMSILSKKEVDTKPIRLFLSQLNKQIIIPKINTKTNELNHFLLSENTFLKENKWGIIEPQNGTKIIPTTIDVVFIPLYAFDNQGYRVGYGGGFYDKFLAKCKKDTIKIGLSFFEEFEIIDDISEFDIPLNYCVTPCKSIAFK